MKVTAILPDDLLSEVKHYAQGKNLTESLIIALKEWINLRHIKELKHVKELNIYLEHSPLEFSEDFTAAQVRDINRNR
jgi:hypothetical protein